MKFENMQPEESVPVPAWEQHYDMLMGIINTIDLNEIKQNGNVARSIYLYDRQHIFSIDSYKELIEDGGAVEEPVFGGLSISFGKKDVDISPIDANKNHSHEYLFFKEYTEKFKQILEIEERQIGPERKIELLKNLETQRQAIHNRAADMIMDNLSSSYDPVTIDHPTARKFFELLFYFWQFNKETKLSYFGDQYTVLHNQKIRKELIDMIKDKTGVSADYYLFGFHVDGDTEHIEFELSGENVMTHRSEIEEIINETVKKYYK